MGKEKQMRTVIVDGNNLAWRSFGQAPLVHEGARVEAIFVGFNMIKKYLKQFEPDRLIVVWDAGRDKYRTDLYPEYKGNRKQRTEQEKEEFKCLFGQMDVFQYLIALLGVIQYRCKGREADDLIYNLVLKYVSPDNHLYVISTDEDMFQLFNYDVNLCVYSPYKDKLIYGHTVEEMFGIKVQEFLLYKSIVGDSSDNLPGVRGIGPKKAQRLLELLRTPTIKRTLADNKILNLYSENRKEAIKMFNLVKFILLDDEEIDGGKFFDKPKSQSDLSEKALALLQSCGFQRHLDKFVEFITPFEDLLKRGEKTNAYV